jgi:Zn-dependent protease with chaperone function
MSWIEIAPAWAAPAAAWMLTYLLHSTALLALAAAVTFALGERRTALQEVIWKCALVGGLATATLQVGLGWTPLAGSWELPGAVVATAEPLQQEGAPLAAERQELGEAAAVGGSSAARHDLATSPAASRIAGAPPAGSAAPTPRSSEGTVAASSPRAAAGPLLAVVAWLALAAFFTVRLADDYLRLAARLRERWPVADGAVAALFGRLLGKSGRRRPVTLTGSERLPVPIAWGLARPEVSLPARVLRDLSPYHQESILAHELAHVLRRDPAWLAAARLLEAVLFFQPLNRVARRRLQEIAEYRCDDRAVELTGRPLDLARCLTEVATWRLAGMAALPVPSMASGSSLGRRVRRLVDGAQGEPLPRWVRPAAVAAVLAVALAAPGVTRGKPAPQEPAAAPAAASSLAATGDTEPGADRQAASESENGGWVIVDGRSWDELTPAERDEVRRDIAAGREAREHALQALEHSREQLRHQRHALRGLEGGAHLEGLEGLEGLSGLIGGSVRLGLTAASAALAAVDMPAIQAEIERAMAEVEHELAREMPKIEAEMARAMAEAERHPERRAEIAAAMAELEAEMPRIEAEIAAAMAEVERELAREMPKIEAEVAAAMAEVARELAREMPKITAEVTASMAEVERELAREMPKIRAAVTAEMAEAERELAAEMPRIEAEIDRAMAEVERELAAIEAELEAEEEAVEAEEVDEP